MSLQGIRTAPSKDGSNLILSRVPKKFFPLIKQWGGKVVNADAGYMSFPKLKCYGRVLERHGIEVDFSMFERELPSLKTSDNLEHLFPYQAEAVRTLLASRNRGFLLALRQGLGKTLVSIEAANQLGLKKILVVAPLTLLTNWEREIQKWSEQDKDEILLYRGLGEPGSKKWTVTNYEMVRERIRLFSPQEWDLVIFDESIRLKNRGTETWNRAKKLVTPRMWLLSGSPISTNVTDLWAQFSLMMPQAFKSFWRFADEYMLIDETVWGKSFLGSKNLDFRDEFSDIMHVVARDEVLDLPPMIFETVYVSLEGEQARLYQEAQNDFLVDLKTSVLPITSQLSQITRLLQIASSPANIGFNSGTSAKMSAFLELLEAGEIPLPTIVWVHWIPLANLLKAHLVKYRVSIVTGSSDNRDKNLQDFITGKTEILIITAGTGKYGLTLTMAQSMCYLEKSYNFDSYIQSLDRVQRIGLDHSVQVFSFVAQNTIDEAVHDNLAGKAIDLSKVTSADLTELLGALDRQIFSGSKI